MLKHSEYSDALSAYITNYKINLLWACDVKNLNQYHTSLRELFGLLSNHNDSKKLENYVDNNRERLSNMDEDSFFVAGTLLDMTAVIGNKEKFKNEKGGHNMCQAIIEIEKRGIDIGEKRGIDIGEKRVNQLNRMLIAESRMDDLARAIVEPSYQQLLFEEFGL
jgi:hypothetical protein